MFLLICWLIYIILRCIFGEIFAEVHVPVIQIDGFLCNRCKHEWAPRMKGGKPAVCPKCKSAYWDRERKYKLNTEKRDRAKNG